MRYWGAGGYVVGWVRGWVNAWLGGGSVGRGCEGRRRCAGSIARLGSLALHRLTLDLAMIWLMIAFISLRIDVTFSIPMTVDARVIEVQPLIEMVLQSSLGGSRVNRKCVRRPSVGMGGGGEGSRSSRWYGAFNRSSGCS